MLSRRRRRSNSGLPSSPSSSPEPEQQPRINSPSPTRYPARIISNTNSAVSNTEPVSGGWTEEEAKNWLEVSGKKWMRYYYRTQGPNKFKMRKEKGKGTAARPLGTGSSDCAPMVHPEEIKITVFEYPDPEDGEYKRGPVRHVQSINPFLTATNMLDALKLVVGGDPKIAAHNAELESAEKEVTRLTKKVESLVKQIEDIESKIEEQTKNVDEAKDAAPIKPGSVKKRPGGVAYTIQGGAKGATANKETKQKQSKMEKLNEQLTNAKKDLAATELALKDAEKHLEELQSKVVKGSKAKTVSSSVTPNANKDRFVPEKNNPANQTSHSKKSSNLPPKPSNNATPGTVTIGTSSSSNA